MKCIMLVVLLLTVLLVSQVFADSEEHIAHYGVYTTELKETEIRITDDSIKSGIATAIATAQHQFSYGVHKWQGSLAVGSYDNKTASSFGVAKRYNGILYTGSVVFVIFSLNTSPLVSYQIDFFPSIYLFLIS